MCANRGWRLTDLRDDGPRMTKRKTKRNPGTSQARHGFKISKNPVVHGSDDGSIPNDLYRVGFARAPGEPFLFAIARDARTIFTSWDIDWRSIFQKAMPADRQVHLRVISGDGTLETTIAVEPMSAMHYVTISGLHNAYRVEIGYFQPFYTWHSVAASGQVGIPPQGSVELTDVDLATIPFHVGFQQLLDVFRVSNRTALANTTSDFQKRVTTADKIEDLIPDEQDILRKLDISLSEVASARREFEQIDTEKLARRSRFLAKFTATSPSWREANWSLAGS